MNKVSIIIAAYNAEKYIEDTLSSVMCQTLKEIEAIVVNDGSTDRTEEIVKDYSKKCNKIKLITLSENKGLLTAHKEAFKVFDGEYVMFLDADDMLSPTACEIAYDAITKEKADIIQFDAEIFGDEDVLEKEKYSIQGLYSYIYPADKRIVFPGKAGLLGSSKQIGFTIWNKIYKKNVIDCVLAELPNTRLTMAEDSMLSFLICYYSRTYASISDKLYLYRFGSGISTAKKLNENQIECFAKLYFVYDFLKDFAEKKGILKECKKRLEEMRIQMILGAAEKFLLHVQEDDAEKFLNVVSENKTPISSFFDALNFLVNFRNIAPQRKLVELCRHLPQFRTEKRKIKTIATYYFRVRNGGIENVIAQTTDAWIKDGYNVILITDEKPSDSDYALNPSIKRVVIPTRTHGAFESYEKRTKAIQNILKDNNVDLMVYHAWQYPQLLSDIISIKQLGIPVAVHTHGVFCTDFASESLDIAYRNLELHKVYEMCDAVITLNQADEAYWSSFGLKCIKTINPISFTKDTKPSDLRGKNILMTCRISPEKQIMDALSIIKKVRKKIPDATLTIVGGTDLPWYTEKLNDFVKENKLESAVNFPGFTTNVLPYYQGADIMLITSRFEGFCLSLMESKMCGLPLVTYNLPNLDSIRENKGMTVVRQNDIDGAAKAIIEILSDENKKKQMGNEARQSALDLYSISTEERWQEIFSFIENADTSEIPYDSKSAAIRTMNYYTAKGIEIRSSLVAPAQTYIQPQPSNMVEITNRIAGLEATIKEIRSSTSYRLGWFLTMPFRKIKDKVKGQKYVE